MSPRKAPNLEHLRYVPLSGCACCYHCGESYQVTPASVSMVAVIVKQFSKEHRKCKLSQAGSDLRAANQAAWQALPPEKRDVIAKVGFPEPKTIGERIAQNLFMQAMAKADLGPNITVERDKP